MYAGIILTKWPKKDYYVRTELIYDSKKLDEYIIPIDENDFDKSHEYRIMWCTCKDKGIFCQEEDSCQTEDATYYKGKIFALGSKYYLLSTFYNTYIVLLFLKINYVLLFVIIVDSIEEVKDKRVSGSRLRHEKRFYGDSSSSTPAEDCPEAAKRKRKEARVNHFFLF